MHPSDTNRERSRIIVGFIVNYLVFCNLDRAMTMLLPALSIFSLFSYSYTSPSYAIVQCNDSFVL